MSGNEPSVAELERLARENDSLREELAACRNECAEIEKRVGQLLHDGVCQDLSAVALYLKTLDRLIERQSMEAVPQVMQHLSESVKVAVDSTHALSRSLRK